jgi:hypothetical protein
MDALIRGADWARMGTNVEVPASSVDPTGNEEARDAAIEAHSR